MKFAKLFLCSLFFTFLFVSSIYLGIIRSGKNRFDDSWQHMIQLKYKRLKDTDAPRIIIIAGSSAAFGLDQRLLEDATGYKVCNLGLQASIGPKYLCEIVKKNVKKGDIVIFAYEYNWWNQWELFDSLRPDLLMSGIDNCYDMYKAIPKDKIPNFLGYIFEYRQKIKEYAGQTGIYSASSFDFSDCQMIVHRDAAFSYNKDRDGVTDFTNIKIDKKCISYFKKFNKVIERRGAKLYFTFPPVIDEGVTGNDDEIDALVEKIKNMGITVISKPQDYFFTADLLFDGFCHCNSVGEIVRTEQLINDLKRNDGIN